MTTEETDSLELETYIDAPLEKVFTYYNEPESLLEIWPSMIEVSDVVRDANGNPKSYNWVYKMAGIRITGSSHLTEFEAMVSTLWETRGGIDSAFDVSFRREDGGTVVRERVYYRVPGTVLRKVAKRVLDRINENELKLKHSNLKAVMEAERNEEVPVLAGDGPTQQP